MSKTLEITISDKTDAALLEATREDGIPESDLARLALEDYLLIRKFRKVRGRMMSASPEELTDADVFERVS